MTTSLNEKFVAYFALLSGIVISAVAMFYSVSGLVAIYPTAVIPIVVMGVAIEVGKISMTLWLKQNWGAPWMYKLTMIPAVIILMIITSGGVFGFLSKAHSDQSLVTGDAFSKVQLIDDRITTVKDNIETQKENIKAARDALTQLDSQVNARLDRGTDEAGAERAVQIRRNQRTERANLNREITEAQNEINRLNEEVAKLSSEKAPLAGELRKVEAEVGPVKYIAALIYGDNPDANLLERAVRWVTLMIVIVLDPVAILLLLASQYSFQTIRKKSQPQEIIPAPDEKLLDTINEDAVTTETSTATSTEVAITGTSSIVADLGVMNIIEEISIEREPIKAVPIEEVIREAVIIEEEVAYKDLPDTELTFDDILVNEEPKDLGLDIQSEIQDEIQRLVFVEESSVRIIDTIKATESVEATADLEVEIGVEKTEYVQNEEQTESSLWTTTFAGSTISQEQYLEKVKKLKGLE